MPPPVLFMRNRNGGDCEVLRYTLASPVSLGSTFGTQIASAADNSALRNMVIQFQGEVYAMAQDGVYKKDDPTTDTGGWTSQITFTTPSATNANYTGLSVIYVNNVPNLVGVFGDTTGNSTYRWVKFDGTTWTQAVSGTLLGGSAIQRVLDVTVYRGVLHIMGESANTPSAVTFDPSTDSFANITHPIAANNLQTSMCVFNDRLFGIYSDGTNTELMEFTAGSWVTIDTVQANGGSNWLLGKWCLFTDGLNLYALHGSFAAAADYGWYCTQWNSSLTQSDITTLVLPSALLSSNNGGTYPGGANILNERFAAIVDQDTVPTQADIYLYYATTGTQGTIWSVYDWNGAATLIGTAGAALDTGGDVYHAIPSGFVNAGERIFTPGELDILITGRQAVVGGERLSFLAFGDAGSADKDVTFFFSTQTEPALTPCTLTGAATGGSASRNVNTIENVDADGATVYTAIWDVGSDSVSPGDRVQVKPRISV